MSGYVRILSMEMPGRSGAPDATWYTFLMPQVSSRPLLHGTGVHDTALKSLITYHVREFSRWTGEKMTTAAGRLCRVKELLLTSTSTVVPSDLMNRSLIGGADI